MEKLLSPGKGYSPKTWPQRRTLKTFHRWQGTREFLQESRPRAATRLSQELPLLPGQEAHSAAWQELTMAWTSVESYAHSSLFQVGVFIFVILPYSTTPCGGDGASGYSSFNLKVPGLYGWGKSRFTVVTIGNTGFTLVFIS